MKCSVYMLMVTECIFVLLLCSSLIHSCGLTTHTEIAHRALEYFNGKTKRGDYKTMMVKHQDAFQAGNPYPDTFFDSLCFKGRYHDISEDTHWAPFLNVTINYIRQKYPYPWDQDTEKLIVFMLGFVSHQIADITWHSLGIDQGFLETMGKIDFHGSYGDAHNVGDFGGDILNLFEIKLQYIHSLENWYVPTFDLQNIYKIYYGDGRMTADTILECSVLMFLARAGEKLAVSKLFPTYAEKSPFMLSMLNDFFLGGIDDMAAWTDNLWHTTLYMLENGTESCQIPKNPLYINCGNTSKSFLDKRKVKNGFFSKPLMHGLSPKDVLVRKSKRGAYLTLGMELKKRLRLATRKISDSTIRAQPKQVQPKAVYRVNSTYARLGWSLLNGDVNHDGYEDLIMGSPGYSVEGNYQAGRVYIVLGGPNGLPKKDLDLNKEANITIECPALCGRHSRFGSALAVVDLNADGINDLAVSAPSDLTDSLKYSGSVHVYYGPLKVGIVLQDPSANYSCQETYCNFGWTLSGGDVNSDGFADLVIGSPFAPGGGEQRGKVTVILAKKGKIDSGKFDWVQNGEQDYSWFGYSVAVKKTSLAGNWLMIGAPTFRKCALANCSFNAKDKQSVGKLYIYVLPTYKLTYSFIGSEEHAKLGSSFSVGAPFEKYTDMLAIGIPDIDVQGSVVGYSVPFHQAGGVLVYNVSNLLRDYKRLVTSFSGDRRFDRFGVTVKI
ncbi:phosphatidylinositol-glycan-specific phospholipase D isoform X2 [Lingula anatina]|uniref:Phosphatidylinositol-glycan-specific phospholipase D n=1 Tax=Lingula anatina TaxID=7574 RepID=A0A1S3IM59_LINAN|nr:phosphatidylinositol-glycan-specific phospholipase D isoform X2 [Lingula anatina]|eukprot:XP_013399325.1 phosphatidylinositol-glycan-specific phospholipase D isoform X2 [Lingula anatina]